MADSDDAWFERQYNPRACVPDHEEIYARFEECSRRVRLKRPCYLDVAYGSSALETLDIFPSTGASRAVLSYIHGGYWRSRDKSQFSFLADSLCTAGFTLVIPNYTLCPQASIEQIVREMLRAHAWIYRNIGQYGAAPGRIVVSGHSAGAHLTAMMAVCDWPRFERGLPPDLVKAALALSGLYDLMPLRRTSMNADLRLDENAALVASPVTYRPSRSLPLVAAVGALESVEFRRQSKLLEQHWPNCRCRTIEVPEANHYTMLDQFATPGSSLLEALEALVQEVA